MRIFLNRFAPFLQRQSGWLLGSRMLIALTGLLLVLMPWTEYFWSFDRFMAGGQDFELGLLTLATLFSLALLLLQQRGLLHHAVRIMQSLLRARSVAASYPAGCLCWGGTQPAQAGLRAGCCSLPMRI